MFFCAHYRYTVKKKKLINENNPFNLQSAKGVVTHSDRQMSLQSQVTSIKERGNSTDERRRKKKL